jgi:hypothetical protein
MAKIWTVLDVMVAAYKADDGMCLLQLGRAKKGEREYLKCVSFQGYPDPVASDTQSQCFSFYLSYDAIDKRDVSVDVDDVVSTVINKQKAMTPKPKNEKQARKDYKRGIKEGAKRAAKAAKREEKRIRAESSGLAAAMDASVESASRKIPKAERKIILQDEERTAKINKYRLAKPGKLGYAVTYDPEPGTTMYYSLGTCGFVDDKRVATVFIDKKVADQIADEMPKEINATVVQRFR